MSLLAVLPEGLSETAFWILTVSSFGASFITAALIPVHGVVQVGSNAGRLAMFFRYVHGPALPGFVIGSLVGCAIGGAMVVELPPQFVQIGVGLFVIWSVLARPPRWLSEYSWLTGGISSFLTMFFGATGMFVANYTKSFALPRHDHVATHAALMTVQHGIKVVVFGLLGFAFGAWAPVIAVLIGVGLAGTWVGRHVLNRMSDHGFKRALDAVLILIALRLIWSGVTSL